ncbi:MotA/TolQ/ExbB proton channel family protein [Bowmanella sp. Y26]|uniref:MotA/TolQ/ExbB proton channel family protein n=1 Tax=Bowmanella yangjiangensis TaxID=2811230 RepID=A0ABS3CUF6_9ALTE|nr:MotA/TolQ/ExbB proton channel family protein [Bowmanella yangjiangensis]MBN7820748.1 MotA/TolQ/ExbB proton channel family protein [Bowmanella yangjiangensis]MBT1064207.1 MotA/TolQ/ExbB proton channel family protein [Bowmanella yangjiangensis]
MDKGSVIGILLVIAALVLGIVSGGESLLSYINAPSIAIVIIGTFGAVILSVRPEVFFKAIGNIVHAFRRNKLDMAQAIETCVRLADKSRRGGLLALEQESLSDPFVKKAMDMLVDGYDVATVEALLNKEIYLTRERNQQSVKVLMAFSEFAPAMGMIGTLVGLVAMLQNMQDPASIGPKMAVALLTTLYGALIANGITTPLAKKLSARSNEILLYQSLIKDAAIKIVQGEHPKATFDFLQTYVDNHKRKSQEEMKQLMAG